MPVFVPFIVGGIVGAAAGLLLAPHSGEQTRAMVSEKANSVMGEAKDWSGGASAGAQDAYKTAQEKGASVFQDVAAKGQEFAKNAQAQANEFVNATAERLKGVAAAEEEVKTDDLRAKIEAARQRIAAQVVANAEQAAGAEPVEAAGEVVAEAAAEVAEDVEAAVAEVVEAGEEAAEAVGEAVEEVAEEVKKAVE